MNIAPILFPLHGFLGRTQDWAILKWPSYVYDWLNPCIVKPQKSFWHNAEVFNQWAWSLNEKSPHILMGYSMGGRFGLHALLQNPCIWKAAIIISAHPGLKNSQEKKQRLEHDQHWAKRFLEDPWDQLMQDWNNQDIFNSGISPFQRLEKDYDRLALSDAFCHWSLGKQDDLSERIAQLEMPILWVVGENDRRYVERAHSLTFKNSQSKVQVVQGAGHRAPWDQPEIFQSIVTQYLSTIV